MIKLLPLLVAAAIAGVGGISAGNLNPFHADVDADSIKPSAMQVQNSQNQEVSDSSELFLSATGKTSF
ncbi:hypothetical protein KW786_01615 [Candidatus Parcubacteria bacterium]|nr:hypothetical protein [Candidatus Parcubacteria bacterium]